MRKPEVKSYYSVHYVLESESRMQIASTEKNGHSYQTIEFPKGSEIWIYISKQPFIGDEK